LFPECVVDGGEHQPQQTDGVLQQSHSGSCQCHDALGPARPAFAKMVGKEMRAEPGCGRHIEKAK